MSPSLDPCLYLVSRREGGAAGACATHIADISVYAEAGDLEETRSFLGPRFAKLEFQESSFAYVGAELS